MRKFESIFKLLVEVRSNSRGQNAKRIKRLIGDSTSNNRTLTVGQTVRYLSRVGLVNSAESVEVVTDILQNEILNRRANRTDAIDLSELVNTYRTIVMDNRNESYRRRIGNALAKVG